MTDKGTQRYRAVVGLDYPSIKDGKRRIRAPGDEFDNDLPPDDIEHLLEQNAIVDPDAEPEEEPEPEPAPEEVTADEGAPGLEVEVEVPEEPGEGEQPEAPKEGDG